MYQVWQGMCQWCHRMSVESWGISLVMGCQFGHGESVMSWGVSGVMGCQWCQWCDYKLCNNYPVDSAEHAETYAVSSGRHACTASLVCFPCPIVSSLSLPSSLLPFFALEAFHKRFHHFTIGIHLVLKWVLS